MEFEIADKSSEVKLNWFDAKLYCFSLGEGWRLPTKEELNEIYQYENDFEISDWYWSSTECNDHYVWCQSFYGGVQHTYPKMYGGFGVRAIRSLS